MEAVGARGRVLVAGGPGNETNRALVAALRELGLETELVPGDTLRRSLRPLDTVVARLDVRPALDGVEPGLLELLLLERRGVSVRNPVHALLACHDKLRTAHALARAGLPHPRTAVVGPRGGGRPPAPPVVVKPRFGSWGRDVFRCETEAELERRLELVRTRPWFERHGALVQELVPSAGHDLRVVVAGGRVVGGIERTAAAGEWRTNVSLGASRRHRPPSPEAAALALAAAAALGAELVGVDLLPVHGGYVIVELNGAVEFDRLYAPPGTNVYAEVARALGLLPVAADPGAKRSRAPVLARLTER